MLFKEVYKARTNRVPTARLNEEMRQFINSLDKNELYAMYEVKI